jgi:hypothetical protein
MPEEASGGRGRAAADRYMVKAMSAVHAAISDLSLEGTVGKSADL